MISTSIAITFILIILVSLLVQPIWVLVVALYMGSNLWSAYYTSAPRESMERLLVAIQEQDEETVRLLTSDDLQDGLDVLFSSFSGEQALELNRLMQETDVTKCTLIDRETATCTICITTFDNCEDLTLRKENNIWVVDFDK